MITLADIEGRALFPISTVLSPGELPGGLPLVAGTEASLLDKLCYVDLGVSASAHGLLVFAILVLDQEIVFAPFGGVLSLTIGSIAGLTAFEARASVERRTGGVAVRAKVFDIALGLRVSASILTPLQPGTDHPDPTKDHQDLPLGTVGFELRTDNPQAIEISGQVATAIPRSMLGNSGIIIEAQDIFLRLSASQELPEPAAALELPNDWRGVIVGRAGVTLPRGLASILPEDLTLERCLIGTGGFSGSLAVDWNPAFAASLLGLELQMAHARIEISDNRLTELELRGALTMKALSDSAGNPAAIPFGVEAGAAGYRIVAADVPPLKLGGVALDLEGIAIGFDAATLTDVEIGGVLQIPGLTDETGADAEIGFEVDYGAGVYALRSTSTPTLRLGPFGLRLDRLELSFDHAGPRSTELVATLAIPGLEAAGGGPAEIGVRIGVGGDRFTVGVSALPPLKLGGMAIQLDGLALAFGGAAPLEVDIAGRLTIPGAQDAAGDPVAIGFELEVDSNLFRIAGTAIPAFEIGGVEVRLTAFRVGFNAAGIVAGQTTISGSVRVPAFKDGAGNPIEIAVAVDLSDGFEVTAVLPAGELEVLRIADAIRIALRKLGVGVGAAGIRFRIGGRIDNHRKIPLVGDLLPSTIEINDLAFRAPNDLDLDIALAWTSGMRAGSDGSGGFEVEIPVGEIGAGLSLDAIGLRLRDTGNAYEIAIVFRGATLEIGPVLGVVDGLGLAATITPMPGGGNLGPLDVALRFVPPKGIGLLIDTPAVRAGGFLLIDAEKGQYIGAVELSLFKKLEINAICIINTKLPDGSDGFALLVVIGVRFPVPIPLGYNFYLAGVGGVLGIQHGFDVDQLRDGLRSGILDRVLFPENLLGDITRVVADLEAVFPIAPAGFLIGPTVTIEWSQPALLTAKLALVLSFGKSFKAAIAGVVRLALPTPDKPILQLQAAFLGTIDFEVGMLSFDASIYDSFFGVGDFKIWIEGDVALRISWGKQKDFVLTVGGFHPAFKPPSHLRLPALKRVTLSVMRDNPRLTFTAYFALTTNTVQFGARAELYVKAGPVEIVGALGFDALFQFSPFRFVLSLEVLLAVRCAGFDLLAVKVQLQLEGPSPWYAKGVASVKVLFFEVKAEFETRFGEVIEQPHERVPLLPLLVAELNKPASWHVADTREASALVARRPLAPGADSPDAFVLETAGRISVRQAVLPFERQIEIFGQQDPADVSRLAVDKLTFAGVPAASTAATEEPFAPAMFKRMADRDKLSAPSYEAMPSGLEAEVSHTGFTTGAQVRRRRFEYEVAISDGARDAARRQSGSAEELARLLQGSAAARSALGRARQRAGEEGAIAELGVAEESFTIVTNANAVVARRLPRSEAVSLLDELTATGGVAFAFQGQQIAAAAVAPGSPAAVAGLQTGDLIVTIDGAAIASIHDARRLAAPPGGREVTYVVRRSGVDRTVKVAGTRDRSSLIVVPDALAA